MNQNFLLDRRQIIGSFSSLGLLCPKAFAESTGELTTIKQDIPVLEGKVFDLVIGESLAHFQGKSRIAYTVNGSLPAPTLIWQEGDEITIRVKNTLSRMTAIHWHGILLPFEMDGVPGISFAGIAPGETFTYRFKVQQSGTYWYHSHAGFQEMRGLYGAIIVRPREAAKEAIDEHVIHLSDWTNEDPLAIFSRLKVHSDMNNFIEPSVPEFIRDIKRFGLDKALDMRKMWNEMRMSPTDLSDFSSYVMHYHLNGKDKDQPWTGLFKKGKKLKLHFINSSSNTFYDVRIPGLKIKIIESDGLAVEPVSIDEFRFGSGETYTAIIEPKDDAYVIFAQSIERSSYALGYLAVKEGLRAEVPTLDAPQWLSHLDMGHGSHGDHSAHSTSKVRHASTEFGPSVDMRVDNPRLNLDDPGVGLRNNGRKVLTLADLHTLNISPDLRTPSKEIELHLTGNMERYLWSIDGMDFGKATPIHFPYRSKVRITLHNDTMMTHPMHLHGMWSDILNPEGKFQVRRHTFPVQPAQRITFDVNADAIGRWAWHCHLLFHMDAGMFREVIVA